MAICVATDDRSLNECDTLATGSTRACGVVAPHWPTVAPSSSGPDTVRPFALIKGALDARADGVRAAVDIDRLFISAQAPGWMPAA